MKQLVGTVVAVSMDAIIKKKDGGTYQGVELVFKDEEGKTQTALRTANLQPLPLYGSPCR